MKDLEIKLTAQQKKAAYLLLENELGGKPKTLDDIAEELGMSRAMLYIWRQNPDFIAYYHAISQVQLGSQRGEVDAQLMKLIRGTSNNGNPSIKALELYYKLCGQLVSKSEVTKTEKPEKSVDVDELKRMLDEVE